MILQALTDYYNRLADSKGASVPPFGFEKKEIPFVIVLDSKGNFVNLRDTRTGEDKRKRARAFLLPKGEKKAGKKIKANLLWDSPQYVLGFPKKDSEKEKKKARQAFSAFKKRLMDTFGPDFPDEGIRAVIAFLERGDFKPLFSHESWPEIEESNANLTFMLEKDHEIIAQRPKVMARIKELLEKDKKDAQICLVTGRHDSPAILHTAIKGVWGAQSSGANIVSFNKKSFCSFNKWKKQGLNAPVGQRAEFAYTTALNRLLERGSRQRIQIGDTTTVFWAEKAHPIEEDFSFFLSEPPKDEEPDYSKIRALLSAVKTGVMPDDDDLGFFILGLAPNASRIAIRFWYEGTVKEIKKRLARYFDDFDIVHSPREREFLSLFQILLAVAPERKADNIPPRLAGDLMQAILSGLPYPRTLFSLAVIRCKAEQEVDRARAAIIKAYLSRQAKISNTDKEVKKVLDKENANIGYVLGRLFAVFERIQTEASGGTLNKTIRDTYFGAASSSPLVVFNRLNDLAVHHLSKIRNSGGNTVWLEKLVQEIVDKIPSSGIPSILRLEDQGRFAVGYYHQRQDFFTKKEDKATD